MTVSRVFEGERAPAAAAMAAGIIAAVGAVVLRGLTGDEEAAHYLAARHAPVQPELFLNLAARPLITLGLALPAQAGFLAARLASAAITGLCVYATTRVARRSGWSPWAAAGLLLVQPFYLAHAGTAMTEPWTASLLAWLALTVVEKRPRAAAGLAALLPLSRMEMVAFWPFVAAFLIRERAWRWLPVLPAGLAVWAALGALWTGDPLWLLHQADALPYPARETLHYARSWVWIFGLGVFVPMTVGLASAVAAARRLRWSGRDAEAHARRTLVVSATGVVVLALVYTAAASWHPISFGNLRYLAFAAPFAAWLGAAGVHRFAGERNRTVGAALVLALAAAATLWSHPLVNNFTVLGRHDWAPAAIAGGWLAWFLVPSPRRRLAPAVAVALGVAGLLRDHGPTLHRKPDPEREAVAAAAALVRPGVERPPIANAHPLLAFHLDGNPYDPGTFPRTPGGFAALAPPGTVWFWETHYAARVQGGEDVGALLAEDWRYLGGVASRDSVWLGAFLVKDGRGAGTVSWLEPGSLDARVFAAAAEKAVYRIAHLRNVVEKEPSSSAAWGHLANAYLNAGRSEDALGALVEAERMGAVNADNVMLRGVVLNRLGRFDEAAKQARRALGMKGDDPNFRYLLGMFLWEGGRRGEGAELILDAAARLPENAEVRFSAGEVYREGNRWAEAEAQYEASIRLRPDHEPSWIRAAECAFARGEREEAERRLRTVIEFDPRSPDAYRILAGVLMHGGRAAEARAVLERGVAATGDPSLRERLEQIGG